ncbi:MAG: MBL fold metallo-hydrolase [Acidobacteriota bacterium]|nr:MBL fold metallo-hydrolase [Blastocatellia bacterium]MDW8239908.1 MBL fold metallo-hydrolase [Acidobacteriota bacterium]
MNEMSTTIQNVRSVTPEQLMRELALGEKPFILDVRNEDEFQQWRIEGKDAVETLHIPYFDFLEDPEVNIGKVPKGREITVVCAKGGSSEYVAQLLSERGYQARNLAGGMIAWGNAHQFTEVSMAKEGQPDIVFYQINRFGKGCLSYLIGSAGEAIVVDPSRHIDQYINLANEKGLKIKHVFDTHLHADHISGGAALAERVGATYHIRMADAEGARFPYESLRDGQRFDVGNVTLRVIALETPGHTPGSTTFLINDKFLLTGDTIFVLGAGRPDLGGQAEPWARDLYRTLFEKLAPLPDDVWVLPAHFSSADEQREDGLVTERLGEIRRTNAVMQSRSEEEFIRSVLASLSEQPAIYGKIRKANLGWIQADEDEVTEMELGKNQCAASAIPTGR